MMYRALSILIPTFVATSMTAGFAATTPASLARDDYPSYPGARAIVAADFDRNGRPDLAQANTGRNSVTILLNIDGTTLTRAYDVAVGTGPFDLATGDFNRDGIPDLAVANADSHSISVLLGKGNGSFTRTSDIPAPSQNPRGITVADVNKDAKPDIVYSGYATRTVYVLIGDGAGGFTKGTAYVGSPANPQGVAAADFNHDGRLDIALAYASSGGLRILYGSGTSFSGRTITGLTYLNVVAIGDFNRDGWDDVAAAATASSTVAIYIGGAAGLVQKATYATGASPRGIIVADINDDGTDDVITANRGSSTVSVLFGDRDTPGRFLPHAEFAAASGSRAVAVADFNADGLLDLATGNEYAAAVTVLTNQTVFEPAAYAFRKRVLAPRGDHPSFGGNHVNVADFNRDGRPDAAVARDLVDDEPRVLSVVLNDGALVALPQTGYSGASGIADVNADGNEDVIYYTTENAIRVDLGDGHGGFVAAPPTRTVLALPGSHVMDTGDMNRDGKPDVAVLAYGPNYEDSFVTLMIGNGDGTFKQGTQAPVDFGYLNPTVRIGDFNRDGKPDVAALLPDVGFTGNDEVRIWLGDGGGGLAAPLVIAFGVTAAEDVNFGDVNGDGHIDAVVTGDSGVHVALGNAAGWDAPFSLPAATVCGSIPVGWGQCWGGLKRAALADLDVDGTLDIVTIGGDLLHGTGDGHFISHGAFDFDGGDVAVANFSRDGLPDIVFVDIFGEVGVLENRRTAVNNVPVVDAGPDLAFDYAQGVDCPWLITSVASDPDAHALMYEWRDQQGTVIQYSRYAYLEFCQVVQGTYRYTVTVYDGRGGSASDSLLITIAPTKEIVLWADGAYTLGTWQLVADASAAGGYRVHDTNLGAPKATTPIAEPAGYVELPFVADPTQTYKLWVRLKADGNSWANDSVWIQFYGATDVAGAPKYGIGTTSGLSVSLEECSNCGVSGWGWEDDGWGAINKNGVLLRFPNGGWQQIRIQTREDGVSVDQIVLSSDKYLTTRPGTAKNDTTILKWTQR